MSDVYDSISTDDLLRDYSIAYNRKKNVKLITSFSGENRYF